MSERRYETKHDAARSRIAEEAMPRLMARLPQLRQAGLEPCGVVLPAHLDPGPYDGEGANPDRRAELMGLPVTWGDRIAFIVPA